MTIYFDGSFWSGVLEHAEPDGHGGERVRAARVVFGTEPTDAELYAYLQRTGVELLARAAANPAVDGGRAGIRPPNPKRAMRQARKAAARIAESATGTAAQEAVRAEFEERKRRSAQENRDEKAERAADQRRIARRKRTERRKGR
jgi:hypothetical protein